MKPPRLLAPVVIFVFCVVVLAPILFMVAIPFGVEEAGNSALRASLFDERQLGLARNSLGLALGTTGLCLVFGVPLAFLIMRTDLWGKKMFGALCLTPILIPPYIHAIVWNHLNYFVKQLVPLDIHSLSGAIFVLSLAYFPFVTLMVLSGLKSIDRNLEEVSLLHCGKWRTASRITLPLLMPHIISGAIFIFIFAIVDFGVPDILRVRVYPVEIFIQFSAFYNTTGATILSLPLIAVTFCLIAVQRWILNERSYVNIAGGISGAIQYRLKSLHVPAVAFCCLILGLSVALPVGVLIEMAGGFSNYVHVFKTSVDQIGYSLAIAAAGSLMALCLGFFLAYLIDRSRAIMRNTLLFSAILPLAIPATTLGIGLIEVWNRPYTSAIFGSTLILLFGYVARFIPFSILTISSSLKQINPRLEEAAALTTGQWGRVSGRILIPLLSPGLMVGFLIVFILSFGELATTLLVIPPGNETIPIKIYNLMHYGADQMVASLCLILIVLIVFFWSLFLIACSKLAKRALT